MTFRTKGRISKTYQGKTTRWVWDGNVPLHECTEEENVTTWLFEEGTFVPAAKIVGDKSYSIITDYLGTPTHAFDCNGAKVWERNLDIYGKIRTGNSTFVPFLYQGQYWDEETDLCYNRFRYYNPSSGTYISQDLIRLAGGNPNIYAYVSDTNNRIDLFALDELYALVARKDGWYPVFEYGKKNPVGEMFLKEGDLWKIGTSKDALKRYTKKHLKDIGVEMKILHTNISRKATLLLERLKLKGYEAWKGFLPPGNKCHH
ncbi:RHS repeat-associated core domain-containing protein [Porphyromonas gulae]|uniref:RHS repeat-associated core domain-containing protein n=1 Tax=Porphyromonas gulae TaxID=111105 RepID=UPI000B0B2F63|nr:RHS repeat-associated core domain-containing protein [Porphyromonas gulae]